jgi:hypothetical protein
MSDALKDLAIVPVTSSDTNYFLRKVTGLKIDQNYSFKFQWVFEDDTKSDWSPGYQINTPAESVPGSPTATVPITNASYIPVTLPVFPANAKRVDVYIVGGAYGTGKVADSFLQAGTKSISVGAGTYQVSLITVSSSGINGSPSDTFTILVTDPTANIQSPEPSKTPSIPSAVSVLGAIQVTWDGKQADGSAQPYGFTAAKVYVGTTAGFTPAASNQVDAFNFKDGQNVINIGVGTLVNGVPMTYGVDYYVKIATTNGTDTSTPVSATGNPKQIGKVGSGDIVSVLADQITTGTLSSSSTITVGTTLGKHLKLAGTGDPLVIYGSGGVSNPVLSFNGNKLTIAGDGAFTGSLTGASGTFGPVTVGSTGISSTNFSIASDGSASFAGILTANGGSIGGWYINSSILRSSSSASATPRIELDPLTPQIVLAGTAGSITMSPQNGIVGPSVTVAGNTGPGFSLSPNGTAVLRGSIYADSGIFSGTVSGATIQTSNSSYIRMDAASPAEIQLHANGFTYDGAIDFGGGTSLSVPFGSLVLQSPSNAPYHKPSLAINDINGISLESYNKIYFSVSRPVVGTNDTAELNVFAYMEQYGAQGAFQGRFNFEANIPVADKSFRPIFAGTTSLPDAAFPNEEIGSIYLEY